MFAALSPSIRFIFMRRLSCNRPALSRWVPRRSEHLTYTKYYTYPCNIIIPVCECVFRYHIRPIITIRCTSVTFVIKSHMKIIMHDHFILHEHYLYRRAYAFCTTIIITTRFVSASWGKDIRSRFSRCLDRYHSKHDGDLNINRVTD